LKRAINIRMGLTRKNDNLPKALLEPLPDGPAAGYVPPLEEMLTAYYNARGWDNESGKPTPSKLSEIGMEWIISDIWK
jgi:aldehyde:ferredoxin oxidoreductase